MKMTIRKKEILYVFCLLPFFKLQTFDLFVLHKFQEGLWNGIEALFNFSRIAVTASFALDLCKRHKLPYCASSIGIICFFGACCFICIINQSIYFGFVFNGVTYIGLALVCEKIIRESVDLFERCNLCLFGVLSIIGAILNILLPFGFLKDPIKATSIYFLGSKNASYFYFIVFLYFFILRYIKSGRVWGGIFIPLLLLAGLFACDSKGGLVCCGIVVLYHFSTYFWKKVYKIVDPAFLSILLVMIFYFVVFRPDIRLITVGLDMIGKDDKYGGRTVLWEQALAQYVEHPIIGNGARLELMNQITQTQAHNFYIDILARYGTIPFIIILGTFIVIINKIYKGKNRKVIALKGVVLFSFLLHCIFDTTTIHFLFIILISVECCGIGVDQRNIRLRYLKQSGCCAEGGDRI